MLQPEFKGWPEVLANTKSFDKLQDTRPKFTKKKSAPKLVHDTPAQELALLLQKKLAIQESDFKKTEQLLKKEIKQLRDAQQAKDRQLLEMQSYNEKAIKELQQDNIKQLVEQKQAMSEMKKEFAMLQKEQHITMMHM